MKILSMTATFGKLSHQTLQLQPGLNIIEAPNEWGKSTWCAFIIAMLYGIDTRQQTTKTALADKERYAPWNAEPMAGRMDICWNGRNITIQRSTKGRIPFGQFHAYETDSGLDIPELTAANCGQMLLGVERSVFTRAGFIRLTDMPLTQDDSLRRRLNNLVTTGDESDAGDKLGKQLRELKNKCRYNRTGLLPQAEGEQEHIRQQLQKKDDLKIQIAALQQAQKEKEQQLAALENHANALRCETARQGKLKIQAAESTCNQLREDILHLQAQCDGLPSRQEAEQAISLGQELQKKSDTLTARQQALPEVPQQPDAPLPFRHVTPQQALEAASTDTASYQALQKKKTAFGKLFAIGTALFILTLTAAIACFLLLPDFTFLCAGLAAVMLVLAIFGLCQKRSCQKKLASFCEKYPGLPPEQWISSAQSYADSHSRHALLLEQYSKHWDALQDDKKQLQNQIDSYAGGRSLAMALEDNRQILAKYDLLSEKQQQLETTRQHLQALKEVAVTAPEATFPDSLTYSAEETDRLLQTLRFELRQLQLTIGQRIGQNESIGQEDVLRSRLDTVSRRILQLEDRYRALELAQEMLHQASSALQRRFAPRISKQAQENFSRLTDGRYCQITLSNDLNVSTCAESEDILRGSQWRSDGTADQLYLSLRLAVADELTPHAPLVLDDALIRFDDRRLKSALALLQEQAHSKQIILFTCQSRENQLLENMSSETQ